MIVSDQARGSVSGDRSHTKAYLVGAPIEVTWRAFTDPHERKTWFGFPFDQLENALELDPPNFFRVGIDHPGLPGPTETSVMFEAVDGGTRITHTHSGFGEGLEWENALQSSSYGVDEMMGDLALYLRTGVGYPRHVVFRCFDLLKGTREVPGGLEVFEVREGTLAAEVGLRPGDTVVGLAGAGVYGFRDLLFALREHAPGDVIEVTWVRGNEIMTGHGPLTGTMPVRPGS
jgi:membrane-associated protease RseP (regulator of RpoE activity)